MKTLLLLRHAKSSRDDPSLRDFDRPLNHRGKDDAKRMGRWLRDQKISPQVVISSPAKRARKTTKHLLNHSGLALEPLFDEHIYEAGLGDLLHVVAQIESQHASALLVGHNPGFEDLVAGLTGQAVRLPTAALACIDLSIDAWTDIGRDSGKLQRLVTPGEINHDLIDP